jgi:hypothetical protein
MKSVDITFRIVDPQPGVAAAGMPPIGVTALNPESDTTAP